MTRTTHKVLGLLAGLSVSMALQAGSVVDTAHNLSATGSGTVRATSEEEICIFCHTSHSSTSVPQLWNRGTSSSVYQPYTSSTAVAQPGQPTGDSLLCLSCHDGTIAIGDVLSRATDITMAGGVTTMPAGDALIGTDLTHDHPVSFPYTGTLATQNGELAAPATLPPTVPLDAAGQMQCTSCHDAHSNDFGAFLVMPNIGSQLCTTCHDKTGWSQTSHNLSAATWNNLGADPWPDSALTTVSDNACGNCHQPHLATGGPRLLNDAVEEANCSACHNGNVAAENVMGDFNKPSAHRIGDTTGVHDPVEEAVVATRHVECADCHDPHATQAGAVPRDTPPNVRGVNLAGVEVDPAIRTYEICLRCHGDSPNKPAALTPRQHDQTNVRLEIQTANPSFHPIAGPGRNSDVPSLIAPLTTSSIIGCVDCHNSNSAASVGGAGPEGPHGSNFDPILARNYVTIDNSQESAGNYALCYSCHSRSSILNDVTFGEHRKHIDGENAPCNVCHDPHGISGTQGNATNNTHLINFDTSVVRPRGNGDLRFVDQGSRRGACYLVCHGKDHNNLNY